MRHLLQFPLVATVLIFGLAACGGDDDDGMETMPSATPTPMPTPEMAMFEVTVTNLTANQPLSPLAVLLYDSAESAWQIGEMASAGLEVLAESGSPGDFVAESSAVGSATGSSVIMPGEQATLEIEAPANDSLSLTVATMLVNTNDAFAGVTAWSVGELMSGDSAKTVAPIYDAGTEVNSETGATIPGPAGGGEGFNSARDDVDYVARHPGVVTASDGFPESTLDESHRFDNGAMLVTITRL